MQKTNRNYDEFLTASYEPARRSNPPMENAFATYTGADISLAYEPAEQSLQQRLVQQRLRAETYWRAHPAQVAGLLMVTAFALGALLGRQSGPTRQR